MDADPSPPRDGEVNPANAVAEPGAGRGGRLVRVVWALATLAVAAVVTGAFLRYRIPGHGFTYVLDFGGTIGLKFLPETAELPVYIHEGVPGYDAQMYAQLALRPMADDPALKAAIDNVPYRARRPLMGWVSWLAGLGRPAWVLNIHACLNLAVWLVLAGLLLRWFRPGDPQGFLRWCGVLLSIGTLSSLRHALTDGPMLLALAGMMALLEAGRRWGAVALGAVAGLTRETAILGGVALLPAGWRDWRGWLRAALQGGLMVLPLFLWMLHVQSTLPGGGLGEAGGIGAFAWPFAGYVERTAFLVDVLLERGWNRTPTVAFLAHIGLTVQAIWIVARPRPTEPWWRIGAVYVVLLAVAGPAVWEGFPGAAGRVLLPLALVFNITVPRRRWGLPLLLAGNLGIFAGIAELRPPPHPTWTVSGPAELRHEPALGPAVDVVFEDGFYGPESRRSHAWRWSQGEGVVRIRNRHAFPVEAGVRLGLRAVTPRPVAIEAAGTAVWSGEAGTSLATIDLPPLVVPPGGLELRFLSGPGVSAAADTRSLSVAVYDLSIELRRIE